MTMSTTVSERHGATNRRGEPDLLQFRLLYAICFSLFLPATVTRRLLSVALRPRADRHKSVFEEARNAAGICATYAFMQ
jgi:hypothetical protein